jgi:hypothetical protein
MPGHDEQRTLPEALTELKGLFSDEQETCDILHTSKVYGAPAKDTKGAWSTNKKTNRKKKNGKKNGRTGCSCDEDD